MGETAPLLILVGYSKNINLNPFNGFMGALPTMINQDRDNLALAPASDRVWAAALTLILLVLALNLLARLVARFSTIKSDK
jgi:phosphate transport system permease protein